MLPKWENLQIGSCDRRADGTLRFVAIRGLKIAHKSDAVTWFDSSENYADGMPPAEPIQAPEGLPQSSSGAKVRIGRLK